MTEVHLASKAETTKEKQMNRLLRIVLLTGILGCVGSSAWAQLEPIGPLTLVPNQPVSFNFQNFIPPQPRYKELQFRGFANVQPGALAILGIEFDYIDSTGVAIVVPAPNSPITVLGGSPFAFDSGILALPFCPSLVSLHLTDLALNVPINVGGIFRHQCFPVPEPSGLLGTGLLALIWSLRRRLQGA